MGGTETTDLVKEVIDALAADPEEFHRAVDRERELLKQEARRGTFDNPQAIVGLEYELYSVDAEDCSLVRIPRRLLRHINFEAELGLHNAETHTAPVPLNAHGIAAQEMQLRAHVQAAEAVCKTEGIKLLSDGLAAVPPAESTMRSYLDDSVEVDGIRIATNMSESVRYHAMSNAHFSGYVPAMKLDAPHVSLQADTVVPESLICSIQPHYQAPSADDLPVYHGYALRVAGPLLALAVNTPFFAPDLYDDAPAGEILDDAHAEHRIGVFESVLNPVGDQPDKVRFPDDVATLGEAIEQIVADPAIVPSSSLVEEKGRFDDRWAHIRHKHGSYWRWVRPVFEGPTRSAANARVEFRPLPAQPTIRDSVAFQAAFAGLMQSLPRVGHPVEAMDWEQARENFYAAAESGLDAELTWLSVGGETTDQAVLYEDLFDHAHDGLVASGMAPQDARRYLHPLRERVARGVTPARWKLDVARDVLDEGGDLADAIHEAQSRYVRRQSETLIDGSFVDWLD